MVEGLWSHTDQKNPKETINLGHWTSGFIACGVWEKCCPPHCSVLLFKLFLHAYICILGSSNGLPSIRLFHLGIPYTHIVLYPAFLSPTPLNHPCSIVSLLPFLPSVFCHPAPMISYWASDFFSTPASKCTSKDSKLPCRCERGPAMVAFLGPSTSLRMIIFSSRHLSTNFNFFLNS